MSTPDQADQSARPRQAGQSGGASSPAPVRVVVIEDEPTITRAIADRLTAEGWEVRSEERRVGKSVERGGRRTSKKKRRKTWPRPDTRRARSEHQDRDSE